MKNYKIAVAGTGYVGLSLGVLLSQHHQVVAVDIVQAKVDMINNKKSPIQDEYIEKYLAEKELDLTATLDAKEAYSDADFVVIAAPTNYDSKKNFFDTSAVEAVIKLVIEYNPEAIMVIKSTIPVGYTANVREKFHCDNIIFSPEFLRESKALYDNLYPSRIIVGTDVDNARLVKAAHTFAELLQEGAIKENIDTLFMGFTEAEAVKLLHILQRMEAGGTQALLMNIYRKIDRTKVQFDFLVVYKEKQFYDDEIEKMGGHVYKLSFREDLNLPKFQKDLAVFFAQHHEYKIVHCHAYTIGYFCLKAAKKAGIPVRIAHSHNNETVHDIKYLPKLFMQRMFTKNATDLFACSEEAGKYLFKDKPFQVLKNAIDSQNFIADVDTRNAIRKELGLKDKFVVGHVGRLHPQKNHDFLIDVFAEIKKKKPNAELILVGTGPLEEKVKSKVAEKGLSDCVHFLGNRKDMNRIYQAMDVFVFPSLFEGLGIVAIEAQAAGVPIVCSEGLPPETDITPIYRKLLLSDGEEKWANTALEMAQNLKAHTNMQQYVIDAGFDMDATAKYMESYYLNRWRTA